MSCTEADSGPKTRTAGRRGKRRAGPSPGRLDDALVACLREVIYWLPAAAGITGPEAYALASMAVSFRVTQYANQTGSAYTSIPPKAVHAVIPKSIFPAGIRARITAWLRPGS